MGFLQKGLNESLTNFKLSCDSGDWTELARRVSLLLLRWEWRDMDVSPRIRKDALTEGEVDGISNEFTHGVGGISDGLLVEFDLIRYKSFRLSELEAGLNVEGSKRCGGR